MTTKIELVEVRKDVPGYDSDGSDIGGKVILLRTGTIGFTLYERLECVRKYEDCPLKKGRFGGGIAIYCGAGNKGANGDIILEIYCGKRELELDYVKARNEALSQELQ